MAVKCLYCPAETNDPEITAACMYEGGWSWVCRYCRKVNNDTQKLRVLDLMKVSIDAHQSITDLIAMRRAQNLTLSRKVLDIEGYLHNCIKSCQYQLKELEEEHAAISATAT